MSGKEFQAGDEVYVKAKVRDDGGDLIDGDGDLRVHVSARHRDDDRTVWANPCSVIPAADYEAALQAKATLDTLQPAVKSRARMEKALVAQFSPISMTQVEDILNLIYRPEPAKPEPNRLMVTFKNFVTEELEKAFGAGFGTLDDVVAQAFEKAASRDDELKAVE